MFAKLCCGRVDKAEVLLYPGLEELSLAAAWFTAGLARDSIRARGFFRLSLAGGETPRLLYKYLGGPPFDTVINWRKTHLYWGDERCVTPDHPDSNFRVAFENLISRVPLIAGHVHRIKAEMTVSADAVAAYEKLLRETFYHVGSPPGERPVTFDLALLGVGPDGHTASLFPEDAALREEDHWVALVSSPQGSPRITLTLPVLNGARCVAFLVAGAAKQKVVSRILATPAGFQGRYPAAMISPRERLVWFVDREANGGI
ncbi:MAG: 6-phosphogluconolactonase [Peptococcaceae bacterium]|nr:6-phosphogluconolactonase [Peptococcaceae bacterium]